MAGEVGHVVYAARVATFLGEKVGSVSFWAGTLLPDIKHLGIKSRQSTHPEDVSLDKLVGKNDFETGMRVHAWIDETRNKFLEQSNIKEILPWHPFVPHALKLLEDEWLYDRFDDWNLIHRSLNKVYEEEIQLIQSKKHIIKWHDILQTYFKEKPNNASRYQLSVDIGLSKASAEEVNSIVETLKKEPKTKRLTDQLIYHLEGLLE